MNYAIRYLTEYRYDEPVVDNLNALRVRPAGTPTQRVDAFVVRLEPEARLHRYVDYYGTEVIEFGVTAPHDRLEIDVRARVSTETPPEPPDASWGAIDGAGYRAAGAEYLLQTEPIPPADTFTELLDASRARTPLATVLLLSELIPDRFEYQPGVTDAASRVPEMLAAGAGVCQDFVHLTLMLLRCHGIAARYVSGYLFAPSHEGDSDSAEVDTHAWIEALVPPAGGSGQPVWVGADPTNRGLAGERHVKVGHGRHYPDVLPIKGVYRGSARATFEAKVQMTLVDEAAAASAEAQRIV